MTAKNVRVAAERLAAKAATCVLSTLDSDGYPAMRALLAPRVRKGLAHMEFTTNTSSRHVAEILADPRACVYFYDPKLFRGLLLKGKMAVSTAKADRDRVWRRGDELYYSGGPADPDYAVMLFTASHGRWYENFTKTDFALD